MTDPITQQPFNLLAYVPAVALALGLAAGWATLKSDVSASDLRAHALADRVAVLEDGAMAREARIRALETGMGRLEERLVSIGEGIARIERALEPPP